MGYSRTLNSLKTITAVATAFNIAACLVTESAQAIGIGRGSGQGIVVIESFTFDLDDVPDQAPNDDSVGVFPGAIQNFNFTPVPALRQIRNSNVCGQEVCPSGTLTVTKFSLDSSDNIPGINLNDNPGRRDPNTLLRIGLFSTAVDFSKDVLRYDLNFDNTSSDPELIWFIESNDSSLINDLSALIEVDTNKIVGIYNFPDSIGDSFKFSDISGQSTSVQVPEPSTTHGLFGLAVFGTVLVLKRKAASNK